MTAIGLSCMRTVKMLPTAGRKRKAAIKFRKVYGKLHKVSFVDSTYRSRPEPCGIMLYVIFKPAVNRMRQRCRQTLYQ